MSIDPNQLLLSLNQWQTLIGAFLGAATPFVLYLFTVYFETRRRRKDDTLYLCRLAVDQINNVNDTKLSLERFLKSLGDFRNRTEALEKNQYQFGSVFVPMLSIRSLPERAMRIKTGSGYIDSKVDRIFGLAADLPHMIEDLRLQLNDTLRKNEILVLNGKSEPEFAKKELVRNLNEYERMVRDQVIEHNFKIYLEQLALLIVAIQCRLRVSELFWKLKFDPRFKFFLRKEDLLSAKQNLIDDLDNFFTEDSRKILDKLT